MLLRFRVANHLSLRDEQELSLIAGSQKDQGTGSATFPLDNVPGLKGHRALPAAVIYGANASGKSNVVAALRYMREAVLRSQRAWAPDSGVRHEPFLLNADHANRPSLFEVDMVIDGVRYQYGFETHGNVFKAEWLYAYPQGKAARLFERKYQKFIFGKNLKGEKATISKLTRENSLFLSAATQNGDPFLKKISRYFSDIDGIEGIDISAGHVNQYFNEFGKIDPRILAFLSNIDAGITDYVMDEIRLTEEQKEELYAPFKAEYRPEVPEKFLDLRLVHAGADSVTRPLPLDSESSGTRRLLVLLYLIFQSLDEGTPFVLDEIDSSFHTLAVEHIISLFASKETNPYGAQLVATTHDTNLLRSVYLRRDEIWFTEKDKTGATDLYPLTDYSPRRSENLEKGYLLGRYGAIPFAGPIPRLIAEYGGKANGTRKDRSQATEADKTSRGRHMDLH
jgi:hypothetical protein